MTLPQPYSNPVNSAACNAPPKTHAFGNLTNPNPRVLQSRERLPHVALLQVEAGLVGLEDQLAQLHGLGGGDLGVQRQVREVPVRVEERELQNPQDMEPTVPKTQHFASRGRVVWFNRHGLGQLEPPPFPKCSHPRWYF